MPPMLPNRFINAARRGLVCVLCCVAAACVSAYLLTFALAFAISTLI